MYSSYEFQYNGECEEQELGPGRYLFEVWGAQGGLCGLSDNYSRGGYTYGIIRLISRITVKVCVGGRGQSKSDISGIPAGGFNGGGYGDVGENEGGCSGGGGGATDIRYSDNISRLIVAGGGGGCVTYLDYVLEGGAGGGLIGGNGTQLTDSNGENKGKGGQQYLTENGGSYYDTDAKGIHTVNGSRGEYGIGGNGSTIAQASAAGGGGGYFGGGGGADVGSGGGGSGFLPSYMIGKIFRGNQEFTDPEGNKEIGHKEDGYARITQLNPESCRIEKTISTFLPMIFILLINI